MNFKLTPNPTFKVTVNLSVPEQKGVAPIEFEFKYKNKFELDAWFKDHADTLEALDAVIIGWKGVIGPEDKPIEYSKAHLQELMTNYPKSGQEITTAYFNSLTESRAKN
ncbi:MAG TPA: hypothetical protein DCG63_03730 [Methylophilaceae bacterium]|nr:hypothetical protein [Methylophilaceae bacterium]